jgi:alkanesulfonate monooxygenase SsuD/methylene tetrahydromethanopterin reductase-like flavin-dependent oxidoreductase (luciferase family)
MGRRLPAASRWRWPEEAEWPTEVDIPSIGRLRLGVGIGWNHVEYEALGTEWKTRGVRQAEQIEVMRRL